MATTPVSTGKIWRDQHPFDIQGGAFDLDDHYVNSNQAFAAWLEAFYLHPRQGLLALLMKNNQAQPQLLQSCLLSVLRNHPAVADYLMSRLPDHLKQPHYQALARGLAAQPSQDPAEQLTLLLDSGPLDTDTLRAVTRAVLFAGYHQMLLEHIEVVNAQVLFLDPLLKELTLRQRAYPEDDPRASLPLPYQHQHRTMERYANALRVASKAFDSKLHLYPGVMDMWRAMRDADFTGMILSDGCESHVLNIMGRWPIMQEVFPVVMCIPHHHTRLPDTHEKLPKIDIHPDLIERCNAITYPHRHKLRRQEMEVITRAPHTVKPDPLAMLYLLAARATGQLERDPSAWLNDDGWLRLSPEVRQAMHDISPHVIMSGNSTHSDEPTSRYYRPDGGRMVLFKGEYRLGSPSLDLYVELGAVGAYTDEINRRNGYFRRNFADRLAQAATRDTGERRHIPKDALLKIEHWHDDRALLRWNGQEPSSRGVVERLYDHLMNALDRTGGDVSSPLQRFEERYPGLIKALKRREDARNLVFDRRLQRDMPPGAQPQTAPETVAEQTAGQTRAAGANPGNDNQPITPLRSASSDEFPHLRGSCGVETQHPIPPIGYAVGGGGN